MIYCGSYILVEKDNIIQAVITLFTPITFIIEQNYKDDKTLRKTLVDIKCMLVKSENDKILPDLSTAFDDRKETHIIYFDKNEIDEYI